MINWKIHKVQGRTFWIAGMRAGDTHLLTFRDDCYIDKAGCWVSYETGRKAISKEQMHSPKYGDVSRSSLYMNITEVAEDMWLKAFENYEWWMSRQIALKLKLDTMLLKFIEGVGSPGQGDLYKELVSELKAWNADSPTMVEARRQRDLLFKVVARKHDLDWIKYKLLETCKYDYAYEDLLRKMKCRHNSHLSRVMKRGYDGKEKP